MKNNLATLAIALFTITLLGCEDRDNTHYSYAPPTLTVVETAPITINISDRNDKILENFHTRYTIHLVQGTKTTANVMFLSLGTDAPDPWATDEVLAYFHKHGYRPLTLVELSALQPHIAQLKKTNVLRQRIIIGLGSAWRTGGNLDQFPGIDTKGEMYLHRIRYQGWLHWNEAVFAVTDDKS